MNDTVFAPLWSNDTDEAVLVEDTSPDGAVRTLASGTDIPVNDPPAVVAQWNRGEHGEFPQTSSETSTAPSHATLEQGRFIRDAHVTLLSVQPSTVVHTSATERTHYVAPSGTVLGIVDYRVRTPSGSHSANRTVSHSITRTRVNQTRLLVDGDVVAGQTHTRTPRLAYSGVVANTEPTTLTLEATIDTVIRTTRRTCTEYNATQRSCLVWDRQTRYRSESITVTDSVDVQPYQLAVSGYVGRYPDGDLGLVVYTSDPWGGYDRTASGGQVNGVWRFYTARDPSWDTLTQRTSDGTDRSHSPVHPLQVHAFPIEVGPTATPQPGVTILDTFGEDLTPPSLPRNVSLDVVEEPYTGSYGLATRWDSAESSSLANEDTIIAQGLVYGVETTRSLESFGRVPIHESNLTLSIQNRSDETVRLRLTLRNNDTGGPIDTRNRDGYLLVDGERLETNATGMATLTIPAESTGVSARYVPGQWWLDIPGYTGDSDSIYIRSPVLDLLSTFFVFAVPVSLFLLAVLLIDRITGWHLWPPWRTL